MKRLFVLTATATLLALLSGCSVLRGPGAQSCDTTSSAPSRLNRRRVPRLSLPWRRENQTLGSEACVDCNAGIVEGGVMDRGVVGGTVVGPLYNPDIIYDGPAVYASQPATTTYGNGIQVAPLPPDTSGL